MSLLENPLQGSNKSVLQYRICVSEILRKTLDAIEEGFPKEAIAGMKMGTNKNAVTCFRRGLHESIENRIQNRHAKNLQEPINSAVTIKNELECLANLRNIRKDNHSSRHHPYICERPQGRNKYRHVNKIEMNLNKSNGTYNPLECYGYGKPGHYKRNCPKQKFTNYSHRINKIIGSCGFWQGSNHYKENCLVKRKFGIKRGQNFSNGPQGGVKEKTRQPLSSTSGTKPSGSKHVGTFAPSTPQK